LLFLQVLERDIFLAINAKTLSARFLDVGRGSIDELMNSIEFFGKPDAAMTIRNQNSRLDRIYLGRYNGSRR
jgi:hypothetical protein